MMCVSIVEPSLDQMSLTCHLYIRNVCVNSTWTKNRTLTAGGVPNLLKHFYTVKKQTFQQIAILLFSFKKSIKILFRKCWICGHFHQFFVCFFAEGDRGFYKQASFLMWLNIVHHIIETFNIHTGALIMKKSTGWKFFVCVYLNNYIYNTFTSS